MQQILTTDAVPSHERLAYWVDMISVTYVNLDCDARKSAAFTGSITHHQKPGLDLSIVSSEAQVVRRTPCMIARDPEDYFLVAVQTRGHGFVEQDGRQTVLCPGDFAIYDSTRPYTLRFDNHFEELVIKVRGEALRSLVRNTEALTATKISSALGPGSLFTSMALTLRDDVTTLPPTSTGAIGSSLVNLVAASLQTLPNSCRVECTAMQTYHLARIKRYIDANLRDPSLSIEQVATSLGMSAGHLYRVFQDENISPSRYLWSQRLENCSRDLLNPMRLARSVSEIAYQWGFNDAAHFSRAFRAHFGCSPREWRRQAQAAIHGEPKPPRTVPRI